MPSAKKDRLAGMERAVEDEAKSYLRANEGEY